eukprot:5198411-Amphidinium_carterae.1
MEACASIVLRMGQTMPLACLALKIIPNLCERFSQQHALGGAFYANHTRLGTFERVPNRRTLSGVKFHRADIGTE